MAITLQLGNLVFSFDTPDEAVAVASRLSSVPTNSVPTHSAVAAVPSPAATAAAVAPVSRPVRTKASGGTPLFPEDPPSTHPEMTGTDHISDAAWKRLRQGFGEKHLALLRTLLQQNSASMRELVSQMGPIWEPAKPETVTPNYIAGIWAGIKKAARRADVDPDLIYSRQEQWSGRDRDIIYTAGPLLRERPL